MRLSLRRFGTLGGTVTPTFTNGIITPSVRPPSDSTTAYQIQNTSGARVVTVDTTNTRVGIGLNVTPSYPLHLDAPGSSVQQALGLQNSDPVAANLGVQVGFIGAGAAHLATIAARWTAAANTNAYVTLSTRRAGSITEAVRVTADGYVGIGVTAPTAMVHAAASTTARASVCLPHGSAPTAPVDGDMWTTTAGLYVRINGVTVGPLS